mmetsp:Transcript_35905/g.78640  ORF Transcript_35905/g.78640 Transcript_35905/m.78640 type:complete len:507 (+) Transcript_35905:80-1600(+)
MSSLPGHLACRFLCSMALCSVAASASTESYYGPSYDPNWGQLPPATALRGSGDLRARSSDSAARLRSLEEEIRQLEAQMNSRGASAPPQQPQQPPASQMLYRQPAHADTRSYQQPEQNTQPQMGSPEMSQLARQIEEVRWNQLQQHHLALRLEKALHLGDAEGQRQLMSEGQRLRSQDAQIRQQMGQALESPGNPQFSQPPMLLPAGSPGTAARIALESSEDARAAQAAQAQSSQDREVARVNQAHWAAKAQEEAARKAAQEAQQHAAQVVANALTSSMESVRMPGEFAPMAFTETENGEASSKSDMEAFSGQIQHLAEAFSQPLKGLSTELRKVGDYAGEIGQKQSEINLRQDMLEQQMAVVQRRQEEARRAVEEAQQMASHSQNVAKEATAFAQQAAAERVAAAEQEAAVRAQAVQAQAAEAARTTNRLQSSMAEAINLMQRMSMSPPAPPMDSRNFMAPSPQLAPEMPEVSFASIPSAPSAGYGSGYASGYGSSYGSYGGTWR